MKILKEKINSMYWTSTFISFDNISSEGIHKVRFEEYIIHHNMLNKCPFHKPNLCFSHITGEYLFLYCSLHLCTKWATVKVTVLKIWQHPAAIGSAAVHYLTWTAASAVSSGPQLWTDGIHVISWVVKKKKIKFKWYNFIHMETHENIQVFRLLFSLRENIMLWKHYAVCEWVWMWVTESFPLFSLLSCSHDARYDFGSKWGPVNIHLLISYYQQLQQNWCTKLWHVNHTGVSLQKIIKQGL